MDDYPNLKNKQAYKDRLARLVASVEGIDDEGLHDLFTARAIKKATWTEDELIRVLETWPPPRPMKI